MNPFERHTKKLQSEKMSKSDIEFHKKLKKKYDNKVRYIMKKYKVSKERARDIISERSEKAMES